LHFILSMKTSEHITKRERTKKEMREKK